jgi:ribose transport system substrate-binding protein
MRRTGGHWQAIGERRLVYSLVEGRSTTRRIGLRVGVGLLAALSLAVAGCGGGDNNGGGGGGGNASEESPTVQRAKAAIEAASKPLEFKAPGPAIDAKKLQGKTVMILSVDQRVPILASAARATQEAAQVVGIKTPLLDAKGQFPKMSQGIQRAIDQKVGALILLGIPAQALPGPLKKLKAAGIPSVSVLNNEPVADEPGQGAGANVYATSAPSYKKGGELSADKAIVDTNGQAKVALINSKELLPASAVIEGLKSGLAKCSTCKVLQETSVPLTEWATNLTPTTQSIIRKNPDLNYILPIFDDMGIFVTAGIRQAGAAGKVHTAALDGTPAALKLVQQGDVFTADPGQPNGWLGWHTLDQAMRGMLKLDPGNPEIPVRFFDKEDLKGVNVNDIDTPYGSPDYRGGFKKLWGVA